MKFLAFATSALAAATLTKRQETGPEASAVAAQIDLINTQIENLQTQINGFDGSQGTIESLNAAANDLVDQLGDSTQELTPIGNIPDLDAIELLTPFIALSNLVESTAQGLIDGKQAYVDAGVGGVVLYQAGRINDASTQLLDLVFTKLSDLIAEQADLYRQMILTSLQNVLDAFADQEGEPTEIPGGGEPTETGTETTSPTETATETETSEPTETATETETETAEPTITSTPSGPIGTVTPTTSLQPPATTSTFLPPYDDNAAAPTAVAAFGAAGIAFLAAAVVM